MRSYFLSFFILIGLLTTVHDAAARFKTYTRLTCQIAERYFYALTQESPKGYENCLEAGFRLATSPNTDMDKAINALNKEYGETFKALFELQQWDMLGEKVYTENRQLNPTKENPYAMVLSVNLTKEARLGLLRGVLLTLKDYKPDPFYWKGVMSYTIGSDKQKLIVTYQELNDEATTLQALGFAKLTSAQKEKLTEISRSMAAIKKQLLTPPK